MHRLILRIDTRCNPPEIKELIDHPLETNIIVNKPTQQPKYKFECMTGRAHPLKIEEQHYVLTAIAAHEVNIAAFAQQPSDLWNSRFHFSPTEIDYINAIHEQPEVDWAVRNSFDGLYVQKIDDYANFATRYVFAVYLAPEHHTFWKIKFHGT